jgi:hypothetical protein
MMTGRPSDWLAVLGMLLGVWLCVTHPAMAQSAHTSVAIPATQGAGVVMLDVSIGAHNPSGNAGGVVRLRRAGGGQAIEVGRFSVVGAGEQSYQFNVTGALKQLGLSGGQAEVEVTPVDRSGGTAASVGFSIGRAEIVTR